jgi:hypothetical protein
LMIESISREALLICEIMPFRSGNLVRIQARRRAV